MLLAGDIGVGCWNCCTYSVLHFKKMINDSYASKFYRKLPVLVKVKVQVSGKEDIQGSKGSNPFAIKKTGKAPTCFDASLRECSFVDS